MQIDYSAYPDLFLYGQLLSIGLVAIAQFFIGIKRGLPKTIWHFIGTFVIYGLFIFTIGFVHLKDYVKIEHIEQIVKMINQPTVTQYYEYALEAGAMPVVIAVGDLVLKIILFTILSGIIRGLVHFFVFGLSWHIAVKPMTKNIRKHRILAGTLGFVKGAALGAIVLFPSLVLIDTVVSEGIVSEDPELREMTEAISEANEKNLIKYVNEIKINDEGIANFLFDYMFTSKVDDKEEVSWRIELSWLAKGLSASMPEITKLANGEKIENFTFEDLKRYEGMFTQFAESNLLNTLFKPGVKIGLSIYADTDDAILTKEEVLALYERIDNTNVMLTDDFYKIYTAAQKLLSIQDLSQWQGTFNEYQRALKFSEDQQDLFIDALKDLTSLSLFEVGDLAAEIALETKMIQDRITWTKSPQEKENLLRDLKTKIEGYKGNLIQTLLSELVNLVDNSVYSFPGIDLNNDGLTDLDFLSFITKISDLTVLLNKDESYHNWFKNTLDDIADLTIFKDFMKEITESAYALITNTETGWTEEEMDAVIKIINENFSTNEDLRRELSWIAEVYKEISILDVAYGLQTNESFTIILDDVLTTQEGRNQFDKVINIILDGQTISSLTNEMSDVLLEKYLTQPLELVEPLKQAVNLESFNFRHEIESAVKVVFALYEDGFILDDVLNDSDDLIAALLPSVVNFAQEETNQAIVLNSQIMYAFIDYNIQKLDVIEIPRVVYETSGEYEGWIRKTELSSLFKVLGGVIKEMDNQNIDISALINGDQSTLVTTLLPVVTAYAKVEENRDLLLTSDIIYFTLSNEIKKLDVIQVPGAAIDSNAPYANWIKKQELKSVFEILGGLIEEMDEQNIDISALIDGDQTTLVTTLLPVVTAYVKVDENRSLVLASDIIYFTLSNELKKLDIIQVPGVALESSGAYQSWVKKSELLTAFDVLGGLLEEMEIQDIDISTLINGDQSTLVTTLLPVVTAYVKVEEHRNLVLASDIVNFTLSNELKKLDVIQIPAVALDSRTGYNGWVKRSELLAAFDVLGGLLEEMDEQNVDISVLIDGDQTTLVTTLLPVVTAYVKLEANRVAVLKSDIVYFTLSNELKKLDVIQIPGAAIDSNAPYANWVKKSELLTAFDVLGGLLEEMENQDVDVSTLINGNQTTLVTTLLPVVTAYVKVDEHRSLVLASDIIYFTLSNELKKLDVIEIPVAALVSSGVYQSWIKKSELLTAFDVLGGLLEEMENQDVDVSTLINGNQTTLVTTLLPVVTAYVKVEDNRQLVLASDIVTFTLSNELKKLDVIQIPGVAIDSGSQYNGWVKRTELLAAFDVIGGLLEEMENQDIDISKLINGNQSTLVTTLLPVVTEYIKVDENKEAILSSNIVYFTLSTELKKLDVIQVPNVALESNAPYNNWVKKEELLAAFGILGGLLDEMNNQDIDILALVNGDQSTLVTTLLPVVTSFIKLDENKEVILSSNIIYYTLSSEIMNQDYIQIPGIAIDSGTQYNGWVKKDEMLAAFDILGAILDEMDNQDIDISVLINGNQSTLVTTLLPVVTSFIKSDDHRDTILSSNIIYYTLSTEIKNLEVIHVPNMALETNGAYNNWVKKDELLLAFDILGSLLDEMENQDIDISVLINGNQSTLVTTLLPVVTTYIKVQENKDLLLSSNILYYSISRELKMLSAISVPEEALDINEPYVLWVKKTELIIALDILGGLLDEMDKQNINISELINGQQSALITKLLPVIKAYAKDDYNRGLLLNSDIIYYTLSNELKKLDAIEIPTEVLNKTVAYNTWINRDELDKLLQAIIVIDLDLPESGQSINLNSITGDKLKAAIEIESLILTRNITKQLVDADILSIPDGAFVNSSRKDLLQTELVALADLLIDLKLDLGALGEGSNSSAILNEISVSDLTNIKYQESLIIKAFITFGISEGLGEVHELARDHENPELLSEREINELFKILDLLDSTGRMTVEELMNELDPEKLTFKQISLIIENSDSIIIRSTLSENLLAVDMIADLNLKDQVYHEENGTIITDLISYEETKRLIKAFRHLAASENDRILDLVDKLDVDKIKLGDVHSMIEEESLIINTLMSTKIIEMDVIDVHPAALDSSNEIKAEELSSMMNALVLALGADKSIEELNTLQDTLSIKDLRKLVEAKSIIINYFMTNTIIDNIGEDYDRDSARDIHDELLLSQAEFTAIFNGLATLDPTTDKSTPIKTLTSKLNQLTLRQVSELVGSGSDILRARVSYEMKSSLGNEKVHPLSIDSKADIYQNDLDELFEALTVLGGDTLVTDLGKKLSYTISIKDLRLMVAVESRMLNFIMSNTIIDSIGEDYDRELAHDVDDELLLSQVEFTAIFNGLATLDPTTDESTSIKELSSKLNDLRLSQLEELVGSGSQILRARISFELTSSLGANKIHPYAKESNGDIIQKDLNEFFEALSKLGNDVLVKNLADELSNTLTAQKLIDMRTSNSIIFDGLLSDIIVDTMTEIEVGIRDEAYSSDPLLGKGAFNLIKDTELSNLLESVKLLSPSGALGDIVSNIDVTNVTPTILGQIAQNESMIIYRLLTNTINKAGISVPTAAYQNSNKLDLTKTELVNLSNAMNAFGLTSLEVSKINPNDKSLQMVKNAVAENSLIVNREISKALVIAGLATLESHEGMEEDSKDIQPEEITNLVDAFMAVGFNNIKDQENVDPNELLTNVQEIDETEFKKFIGYVDPYNPLTENQGMTIFKDFLIKKLDVKVGGIQLEINNRQDLMTIYNLK